MKKIIALSLAAVMMMILFCACSSDDSIIGTWKGELSGGDASVSMTYTFNKDKTGEINAMGLNVKFTYEVDGDKITTKCENKSFDQELTYVIKGDTLTLTSKGQDIEFKRVKK